MWQSLFKKYLSYEKSQGDEERIEHVKQKAKEYVEAAVAWYALYMIVFCKFLFSFPSLPRMKGIIARQ